MPGSSRRIYPQKGEITASKIIESADTSKRSRGSNHELLKKNSFRSILDIKKFDSENVSNFFCQLLMIKVKGVIDKLLSVFVLETH